jgi:SAM-dependent MidA family methyltransferase
MNEDHPLFRRITDQIAQAKGWIGFDALMQQALYAPGLGYYASGRSPFGSKGDFLTAPMLDHWLADSLWTWSEPLRDALGPQILEFGGGRGDLAARLLERAGGGLRYEMLELSGSLRAAQAASTAGHGQLVWREELGTGFKGLMIANEVLDAMPVASFEWHSDQDIRAWGVGISNGQLVWQDRPAEPALRQAVAARAAAAAARGMPWASGHRGEWCPFHLPWIHSVWDALDQGAVLLIDYGFAAPELDHPGRSAGTLCAHYRHQRMDDPDQFLVRLGEQDLTAHVDFSSVAQAALQAGFHVQRFQTQAGFLLDAGLLKLAEERLAQTEDLKTRVRLTQSLQTLLSETDMGEVFKVMLLSKNLDGQVLSRLAGEGDRHGCRMERLWA